MYKLDAQIEILKEKSIMFEVTNSAGNKAKEPFIYLPDAINSLKKLDEWIDINKHQPHAWEKGEWDGDRTDFVLIATDKKEILIARAYVCVIGGYPSVDWYQKDDFDVKGNVTHWKELSEHPVFI